MANSTEETTTTRIIKQNKLAKSFMQQADEATDAMQKLTSGSRAKIEGLSAKLDVNDKGQPIIILSKGTGESSNVGLTPKEAIGLGGWIAEHVGHKGKPLEAEKVDTASSEVAQVEAGKSQPEG